MLNLKISSLYRYSCDNLSFLSNFSNILHQFNIKIHPQGSLLIDKFMAFERDRHLLTTKERQPIKVRKDNAVIIYQLLSFRNI